MKNQDVPVRIVEEPHVADARVHRLAEELDSRLLEPPARRSDIRHTKSDSGRIRRELDAFGLHRARVTFGVSNSSGVSWLGGRPSVSP